MADLKASTDKPSNPLGHLRAEILSLSNKVNNLESSLAKKVSSKLEELVPRIVANAFKERMPELLSDILKNIIPNIIEESIHQALPKFDQRIQETLFASLQKDILTAIRAKVGKLVKKTLWKEMDIVKDLMSCCGDKLDKAQGGQQLNDDEMASVQNEQPYVQEKTSSEQTPSITEQVPPKSTALVVHALEEKDSEEKKTSSEYSSTPPIDENNRKGIATVEEPVKHLMPLIEQGESDTKMLNLQQFSISGKKITLEDAQAQLTEMKRLADLKAEQEKTEQKLKALSNEELEAQAAQLASFEAKRKRMLEEYNHYITYRANKLPIIKISYKIEKKLGFSEWIEVHTLASKNKIKVNDIMLKNLKAKFKWIKTQAGKLGIPPPPKLTAFRLFAAEKKRKRSLEIIKEVFVIENIVLDGMHRNLIPPPGRSRIPLSYRCLADQDSECHSERYSRGRRDVQENRADNRG
ncbi:hypothetical protein Tco_1021963 [Tanacetum coccineum]